MIAPLPDCSDFIIPDGWENGIGTHPIDMYRHVETGEIEYIMALSGDSTQKYRLKKDGRGRDGRQSKIIRRSREVNNFDEDKRLVR